MAVLYSCWLKQQYNRDPYAIGQTVRGAGRQWASGTTERRVLSSPGSFLLSTDIVLSFSYLTLWNLAVIALEIPICGSQQLRYQLSPSSKLINLREDFDWLDFDQLTSLGQSEWSGVEGYVGKI